MDVSEHSLERLHAKILRDEILISATMNNIRDGIITIDALGTIESFNAGAAAIFGYSASEIMEKK